MDDYESEVLLKAHVLQVSDLLVMLETTAEGLTQEQAKKKKKEYRGGRTGTIPKPTEMPEWLCCLLPCLDSTVEMKEYKRCLAQSAYVKRQNRNWVNMDVMGLLRGDLVQVKAGEIVPADIRVVTTKELCTLDPVDVSGGGTYTLNQNESSNDYQYSPNMAFAGYKCIDGEFQGIVVATGGDTLVAQLMRRALWPIKAETESFSI